MTVTSQLLDLIQSAKVYDLAQPYFIGMPHHPVHPPYLFGLVKKHGEFVSSIGASSASEALALGAHVGTHIDALCHFSRAGKLCDGGDIAQSYTGGIERLSVDTMAPIFRRGVLLDIAGLEHVDVLPIDFLITAEHLDAAARAQGVEVRAGDVVLLRTGWARYEDAARFIAQVHAPGPGEPAARWISGKHAFAAGSDTVAFEFVPSTTMPVHARRAAASLVRRSGVHEAGTRRR
jgi:kynurenine formamidase